MNKDIRNDDANSRLGPDQERLIPNGTLSDFVFLAKDPQVYAFSIEKQLIERPIVPAGQDRNYLGHTANITRLASSLHAASPTLLVSGGEDGALYFWSLKDQSLINKCLGHAGPIRDISIDSKEMWVASVSYTHLTLPTICSV